MEPEFSTHTSFRRCLRLTLALLTFSFVIGCANAPDGPATATVAGNGKDGSLGNGGPAIDAEFNSIFGIAVDSKGNLYISDAANEVVRKVDASSGLITIYAGNGAHGYSGDGGQATSAQLFAPFGLAFDKNDDLYIADRGNYIVRKVVAATGIITTIAGTPQYAAFSGDGGLATKAAFDLPQSIALDPAGNVYVGDDTDGHVRRIDATTGIITTVAGGGTSKGNAVSATSAVIQPDGVAIDSTGNLYIGDRVREAVCRVDPATGVLTIVAGAGMENGNNVPATSAALVTPDSIAFGSDGSMYIGGYGDGNLYRVDSKTGTIYLVTAFASIPSIAMSSSGVLYVADTGSRTVSEVMGLPERQSDGFRGSEC